MANEVGKWWGAEYPYDNASCGQCLSSHVFACDKPEHKALVAAVKEKQFFLTTAALATHPVKARKIFLALRKKFARFYPRVRASK